jgi:hypothetical protein
MENQMSKINPGKQCVSARQLYQEIGWGFKGENRGFYNWIYRWIYKFDLQEHKDFEKVKLGGGGRGHGRSAVDYALEEWVAVKISTFARTETGDKVRVKVVELAQESISVDSSDDLDIISALNQQVALSIKSLREIKHNVTEARNEIEKVNKLAQANQAAINQVAIYAVTSPMYHTIMGWSIDQKLPINGAIGQALGKKAASLCRQRGFPIGKVPSSTYGSVGNYPDIICDEVFQKYYSYYIELNNKEIEPIPYDKQA